MIIKTIFTVLDSQLCMVIVNASWTVCITVSKEFVLKIDNTKSLQNCIYVCMYLNYFSAEIYMYIYMLNFHAPLYEHLICNKLLWWTMNCFCFFFFALIAFSIWILLLHLLYIILMYLIPTTWKIIVSMYYQHHSTKTVPKTYKEISQVITKLFLLSCCVINNVAQN